VRANVLRAREIGNSRSSKQFGSSNGSEVILAEGTAHQFALDSRRTGCRRSRRAHNRLTVGRHLISNIHDGEIRARRSWIQIDVPRRCVHRADELGTRRQRAIQETVVGLCRMTLRAKAGRARTDRCV